MLDELIEALSVTGIPFVRNAWVEAPAGDYGVCEMVGEPDALWGDDGMVSQRMTVNVYLYSRDGKDFAPASVNDALKSADVLFQLTGSQYLQDLNMNRWTWRVTMEKWYG